MPAKATASLLQILSRCGLAASTQTRSTRSAGASSNDGTSVSTLSHGGPMTPSNTGTDAIENTRLIPAASKPDQKPRRLVQSGFVGLDVVGTRPASARDGR